MPAREEQPLIQTMIPARRYGLALLVLVAAFGAVPASAAPKAALWERWTAHDPSSTATIDHGWWDGFLETYVSSHADGVNRVAYGRVSPADRRALDDYIVQLAAAPISAYGRDEQRGRGRGAHAQRHRAPHPEADLARPPHPLTR